MRFKTYLKEEQLKESALETRNFPVEDNPGFSGVGLNTPHVTNSFDREDGTFSLIKDVAVTPLDKSSPQVELTSSSAIYITRPGKLYRGKDVGEEKNKTGIYTKIGIKSAAAEDAIGYIPIGAIKKPSGSGQSRLHVGKKSQDVVVDALASKFEKFKLLSSAKIGNTGTDIHAEIDQKAVTFEVKGRENKTDQITFFDKAVSRTHQLELFDQIAEVYVKLFKRADEEKFSQVKSFVELVDVFRAESDQVGFIGDPGVQKTGKMPPEFRIKDGATLQQLRKFIIDHFADGKDNYFTVYNRSSKTVDVYFTGFGENTLHAPELPNLSEFVLRTYGSGTAGGGTRVALMAKLAEGPALTIDVAKLDK